MFNNQSSEQMIGYLYQVRHMRAVMYFKRGQCIIHLYLYETNRGGSR